MLKLKIRLAHVKGTRIKANEPLEGTGPWFEFLEERGEGIAHVAFLVKDIKKSKVELTARGTSHVPARGGVTDRDYPKVNFNSSVYL
jgi:4-hydroxyphenylpyruvate dioxygenase-like putative hemolysin